MANNYKSANTYIRTLYAEGFSSLMISFYKTNLTFGFSPYSGKDNRGLCQYNNKIFLSTSVNYESSSFLYSVAISILNGNENQVESVLACNNNSTLVFEYKPDPNNQMNAYLTINKNNMTIPFKFSTNQYKVNENGQMVTKVIQSGLGVFAKTLEAYLMGIGADLHLSKLTEEELDNPPSTNRE